VSEVEPNEGNLIEPLIWVVLLLPDITIASDPYLPILTVLSEKASITGKPPAVLTENNDPVSESSTWNNLPTVPSTVNTPEPLPYNEAPVDPDCIKDPVILKVEPSNNKLASPLIVDELTEVITRLSPGFVYEVIPAFGPVAPWAPCGPIAP
jgi:hypothetical protein